MRDKKKTNLASVKKNDMHMMDIPHDMPVMTKKHANKEMKVMQKRHSNKSK